ncbi:MAG: flippase-like domain-containing protein [Planctomycetes bacterium]|nr:flippase-like domain-containing protein [Planctomycetota bacterium]
MKLKRSIPVLKWSFLFALVALASWYGYRHPELFAALGNLRASYLAMLLGLVVAKRLAHGLRFRLLTSVLGLELGYWEAFGLVMSSSMYSSLAPGRAGLGAQALYLKKRHGLSYAHFASLVAASNLLGFLAAALIGLVACLASQLSGRAAPSALVMAFLAILLLCLGGFVVLLGLRRLDVPGRVPTQFLQSACRRLSDGMHTFWGRRDALVKVVLLQTVEITTSVASLWIACAGVGLSVGLAPLISMVTLTLLALLLPLTPGNFGVSEGIISGAAHLWGLPVGTALMAALVRRAVGVITTFVLGVVSTHALMGGLRAAAEEAKSAGEEALPTDAENPI